MQLDEDVKFYCPRCNREASLNLTIGRRDFAVQALTTPYFLCPKCRFIFISKQLVRKAVSEWWHTNKSAREIPFRYFYNQAIKYLEGSVLAYHKSIGYRSARFRKE